jgi:hypothetical protein
MADCKENYWIDRRVAYSLRLPRPDWCTDAHNGKKGLKLIDESQKRSKLQAEIRKRLECVCGDMAEDDFEDLIGKIADNSLKADARLSEFGFGSRPVRMTG